MLHDIGLSGSKHALAEDVTADLMRLTQDPLLLRGFLMRSGEGPRLPASPATPSLAACVFQASWPQATSAAPRSRTYPRREPILSPSIRPDVFTPSAGDLQHAFEIKSAEQPPRMRLHRAWPWLAASVIAALYLIVFFCG